MRVPCRCVSRSEAHGWVKDTCALSKGALDQMQAQSSRLGRERINATLGGQHFGEPQRPGWFPTTQIKGSTLGTRQWLKLHRKCARSDLSTARHLGQDAEEDAAPDTGAIYLPQNPGCDLERPGEHGIKKKSRKSGSLRNSSDVRLKGELQ